MTSSLPTGLRSRALSLADARAVTELIAAEELHDTGEVSIEEADIVSEWQRPSFDVTTSTLGVFDADRLVGYAEWWGGDRAHASVQPEHQGRGIGTYLARWIRDTARAGGQGVVGMPTLTGSAGDRLMTALGYRARWTSWVLRMPGDSEIPPRPLPDGYVVREVAAGEHRAVWTVLEDAFLEWSDRERQTFEDFTSVVMERPGYEPWNLRVVTDPLGEVVGAAVVFLAGDTGFVDRVGVQRSQRNRGLATALLADAFAAARGHGATTSELSTDSRTGALGLYERVGMQVEQVWVNRAIDL